MSEVERNEVKYRAEKASLVSEPIFKLTRLRQSPQQEAEMDEDKKISTMAELGEFVQGKGYSQVAHIPKGGQVIQHREYIPKTRVIDSLRVRYSIFLDDTRTGRTLLHTQVEHAGLDSILKHQLGLGSPKRRAFFRALANGNNHHIVRGQGKKRNHRLEATRTEL